MAAIGQAARFGFALAEFGLANGLVLFQPLLDSIPLSNDVHVDWAAPSEPNPGTADLLDCHDVWENRSE